jgi:hypothetical protein
VDLSPLMAAKCEKEQNYDKVIIGAMQRIIPSMQPTDHIVSISSLHFLSVLDLNLVFMCCFRLARKSVTLMIDDIPDDYNKNLVEMGYDHMIGVNHVVEVEAFGVPRGWKLVDRWRDFGWQSPKTKNDVFTTVFRFEKD